MHIVVVRHGETSGFPPAINLVESLLRLGHRVTFFANGISEVPSLVKKAGENLALFDMGPRAGAVQRIRNNVYFQHVLRAFLETNRPSIDYVWTTTDISAREAGKILFGFKHIMQISELVEYVPLIMARPMPLHNKLTVKLAQKAYRVVVPEYNRAHIQRVWWGLDRVPAVLPNRPQFLDSVPFDQIYSPLLSALENEKKKVLLYQGVFSPDRDLLPYAESLKYLDGEYALYLMGKAMFGVDEPELMERLRSESPDVHFLGFVPAPSHLEFTRFGYIGLLPYSPATDNTRFSKLNALYCAPNKIWEYSKAGLPMLGSDVPGLRLQFERYDMGLVTDMTPEDIAAKVRLIESRYDEMAANARRFYDSIDFDAIVAGILEGR